MLNNNCLCFLSTDNVLVLVIIFHHLAKHNSKIWTPTSDRLQDRSIVDRSEAIVDAVFWNGDVYDCETNDVAVTQLRSICGKSMLSPG